MEGGIFWWVEGAILHPAMVFTRNAAGMHLSMSGSLCPRDKFIEYSVAIIIMNVGYSS